MSAAHQLGAAGPPTERLLTLLAEVRRGLLRALLLQGLVAALAISLAILLAGTALAALGISAARIGIFELGFGLAGLGYLAWLFLHNPVRSRDPIALAAWLDGALGALRPEQAAPEQLAESAVRLGAERGAYGSSAALADAAIERADRRLREAKPLRAVTEARRRVFARWMIALVLLGMTCVSVASVSPAPLHRALRAVGVLFTEGPKLRPELPLLRLGDVQVSYRYPAYAERAPKSEISGDGALTALPGTEVTLKTRVRDPISKAELVIRYGPGKDQSRTLPVQLQGDKLTARLVLSRGGRYHFTATGAKGGRMEQRPWAPIELEADAAPKVTILSPKKSPIELNGDDRLRLSFTAEDDFRLGEAKLHWNVIGSPREGRLPLAVASAGQRSFRGRAEIPLKDLELRPGDRVAYTVEFADNDDVSGPKIGASQTQELRVYSKEAHHRAVLALEEKALDAMVDLLAANLEHRFRWTKDAERYDRQLKRTRQTLARADEAEAAFRQAVEAARKDPSGAPALAQAFERARADLLNNTRNMRRVLFNAQRWFKRRAKSDRLRSARIETQQGQWIGALEESSVYLADLLNDQRLKDAEALTQALREQQQALRAALKRYKESPNPEDRALLAETIEQLRQKIAEISAELSKLRASIPPDFVNPDAIAAQPPAQLDALEKMIEDGDLDGAMLALDRMLGQTEQSLAALQEGRQEMASREYSEVAEQARKIQQSLDEIEREQRELARRTEAVSQELMGRMKSRLGEPEAFVERQKERLERAKAALKGAEEPEYGVQRDQVERTQRRLQDSLRAVRSRDFGATQEVLKEASELLDQLARDNVRPTRGEGPNLKERVDKAKPEVKAVLDELRELMPDPGRLLTKEERERLTRYKKEQEGLREKTAELGEQLTELDEQLPIVGPKGPSAIEEAKKAMRGARDQLKRGDAPGALKEQRGALEALSGLRSQLQQLGPPEGAQAAPGGVPLPFGGREGSGKRGGGAPGTSSYQRVEIPKPENFQAPDAFRRDILEAAKQGTARDYEDAVRKYYEELVR